MLEGHVSLDEYGDEGPYGDHTGYYNAVERFPVFRLSAITMRRDPIYLSTFTGRPPDEPSILGEALNEVFIPLLQQQFPEIVDFWLPPEGCSYRIAVVSIRKAYPGHAKRVMMGVWSFLRQFMYTKFVIVVDDDIDARDWKDVMWAVSTRMDPVRDVTLDREHADRLSRLCLARIGSRRQDRPRRDQQIAARDQARMGPADPHDRRDRRRGDRQMGQLRPARIRQADLEMTGDLMTEVKQRSGRCARPAAGSDRSRARRAGADAADAVLFEGISLSHARRLGKTEKLERSEGHDLGLRVFIGRQQAIVSSTDRSPEALPSWSSARWRWPAPFPRIPYCGIADPAEIAHDWPALDMLDPEEPSAEILIERARAAEEAALAVTGVTNSEGAEAGWGRSSVALAASNGFAGAYSGSSHGVSASVIGGSGTGMERDYDFASAIFAADLRDPAEIGKSAGERAVKRLGAKKMPTCRCPVVFDPRVARGFISHLLGAISGPCDRPRHELSEGSARPADLSRGDHDHR